MQDLKMDQEKMKVEFQMKDNQKDSKIIDLEKVIMRMREDQINHKKETEEQLKRRPTPSKTSNNSV